MRLRRPRSVRSLPNDQWRHRDDHHRDGRGAARRGAAAAASTSGRPRTTGTTSSSPRTSRSCAPRLPAGIGARGRSAARGLNLAEINRLQRRIAYVAPATAVAVNMHHYFVGLCADLHRRATRPVTGCCARRPRAPCSPPATARRATTSPCCCRRRKAERVDGGWEFTGHKIFGSLSPVWTYLGIHGMDTSDPDNPQGRPRLPAPRRDELPHRGDLGHDGHAGDDVERHDPRPRLRARRGGRSGSARRGSPVPACSTSPCSPGRCSASPACTARSPSGRSTTPSPRCTSASRSP